MTLSHERQEALTATNNQNIADGNAPYTDATIRDHDELRWIFEQRHWSGAYFLPDHQSRADLTGADLTGADLTRADLTRADLTGADLDTIRQDIYAVLDASPLDVLYLLRALDEGKVDGSIFRDDCEYGCLIGSLEIGKIQRLALQHVPEELIVPRNTHDVAQRWFAAIRRGDTPANNAICALTREWVVERLAFYDMLSAIWPVKATQS